MFIHIDYQDSRPIYEQIYDGFRKLIINGVLESNEQLPSVRSLAVELSTNPNTVQKAYAALEPIFLRFIRSSSQSFVKNIRFGRSVSLSFSVSRIIYVSSA